MREAIAAPLDRGVRAYRHGYPSDLTGWHYHPEYELHAIRRSSGLCYVGTYTGPFEPGNLILTGPNLPHMWVTDADGYADDEFLGDFIPGRDLVLQFSAEFAGRCIEQFADCSALRDLLTQGTSGLLFSDEVSASVIPKIEELVDQYGPRRLALFFDIVDCLIADEGKQSLSVEWKSYSCKYPQRLENILRTIAENISRPEFTCSELAEMENMELSTFSRFFERHIRCGCVEYINRLRIFKACQLLIETDGTITGIAHDVGYGTLSTFNRNFQRYIDLSPTAFRSLRRHGQRHRAAIERPPKGEPRSSDPAKGPSNA
nr:AraC family transcriptional regulator [Roseospira visakhapatnamensis]